MGPGVKVAGDGYAHPRPRGRPPRPRPTVHGGRDARPQARAARGLGRLRGGHVPGRGRVRVAVLRRVLHHAPPRAHPLVRDAARVDRPPHGGRLDSPFAGVRPARRGRPAHGGAAPERRRRARSRVAHSSRLDHVVGNDVPVADLIDAFHARLDLHPRRVSVRAPGPRPRRGARRLEAVVPAIEGRGARGPPRGAIPQPGSPDRWLLLSDDGPAVTATFVDLGKRGREIARPPEADELARTGFRGGALNLFRHLEGVYRSRDDLAPRVIDKANGPFARRTLETGIAGVFGRFARFPAAREEPRGDAVEVLLRDVRFGYLSKEIDPFTYIVRYSLDGRVLSSGFPSSRWSHEAAPRAVGAAR